MRFASLVLLTLLGSSLGSSFGCSREKGSDCQKLVQLAGPQRAAMAEAFGQSNQSPAELEALAVSYDKTAADLSALDLKDESIKQIATDYAALFTKAAQIRRDQAAAAGSLDPAAAAKSQATSTTFVVDEMRMKARLNTTCQ